MTRTMRAFTLIELMIVIAIISIIAALAVPNLLASRKSGAEASAIGGLKTIGSAEVIFREGDKERDGNLDYGMLSELGNTTLVDVVIGSGTKHGYLFQASYSYLSSDILWFGVANPQVPLTTGDRYFETNVAGVIFYTTRGAFLLDTRSCTLPTPGINAIGK